MDKKSYLSKLMTVLDGKRPMARGVKVMLEHNILTDQTISALQHIFAETITQITDDKTQDSLLKAQTFLQKLQLRELEERSTDDELDEMLENI